MKGENQTRDAQTPLPADSSNADLRLLSAVWFTDNDIYEVTKLWKELAGNRKGQFNKNSFILLSGAQSIHLDCFLSSCSVNEFGVLLVLKMTKKKKKI